MLVRQLRKEDISQCLKIYNYYIENTCFTFEEQKLLLSEFEERAERISARYPFLVATEGEYVVGYAYLDTFCERSAYRYTADLSVYVEKDFRQHGIGTRLLQAVESEAQARKIRNLVSVITSKNENSIAFHEKNGFVLKGELTGVGLKFGEWLDVRYYQKELERVL